MRPSAFANGNNGIAPAPNRKRPDFNEAVGFRQRKYQVLKKGSSGPHHFNEAVGFRQRKFGEQLVSGTVTPNFNEAVGFRQRKFLSEMLLRWRNLATSMRPSAFANGNDLNAPVVIYAGALQ